MSKFGSKDCAFFLIDGLSVLGALTELSDSQEALTEDAKGLGVVWPEPTPTGDKLGTLAQNGFYDDEADGINDALADKQGDARVINYGFEGNAIGKKCVGLAGTYASKYTRISSKGQLHKANAQYSVAGSVDDCVILHEHGPETAANGNTEGAESHDSLAPSASGGAGYLQVSALTLGGYTNVAIKVRHSEDDLTYADLVTFAVRTTVGAERKAVAGDVYRHLAHSWQFTGAGAGQSVTYMVAFSRTPDPA